ncbi:hypothetical protein Pmar_PMAR027056 [Perkinsus marinus ATCC 50983]|uniref:Uncharacterized protein n=1 Tax=Perkinsus marinus (strain ATCC 50983 / TXsc) TaxID=423536 RepID=C5LXN3_PERM5|nr:hypothetical protein Pmar_PMAR027056 [Perkinsus marinus ATCC 50983]EEQ98508.1 hypothetical protein Pmar_PMAR027056 [Perkinsus marinus ATCC 50983]|eukprot:XP_002765791.1 hypothetical protein Pmar_PMAR027056 [Perkinsus marinus ATCC 50983]
MVDCMYNPAALEDPIKLPSTVAKAVRCKFVMSIMQEFIGLASASLQPSTAVPRVMFICDDESALFVSAGLVLVRAALGPHVELECCTYNTLKQRL